MRIKQKLKSTSGFTLAETMLAVLIMLLVATILSTGIPVAQSAYEKVVLSANAQSLLSTSIAILRDELGTAWDVVQEPTGGVSYYSADTGARTRLYVEEGVIKRQEFASMSAINPLINNKSDAQHDIISEKASTGSLEVKCGGITYDSASGVVTVTGLAVSSKSSTLASLDSLKIKIFSAQKAA